MTSTSACPMLRNMHQLAANALGQAWANLAEGNRLAAICHAIHLTRMAEMEERRKARG